MFATEATLKAVHTGFPGDRLFQEGQRGRKRRIVLVAAFQNEPKLRKSSLTIHMPSDMYSKVAFPMHVRGERC